MQKYTNAGVQVTRIINKIFRSANKMFTNNSPRMRTYEHRHTRTYMRIYLSVYNQSTNKTSAYHKFIGKFSFNSVDDETNLYILLAEARLCT